MVPRATCRSGFTIVELLVVTMVVAVLIGIAMPHVDVARHRVENAVRETASTLAAARYRAAVLQHDVIVSFDAAARRITVHEDQNNDGAIQPNEPVRSIELPEGIIFGRGSAPVGTPGSVVIGFRSGSYGLPHVTFHRNGSASESEGLYLTSTASASNSKFAHHTRALTVERATGRVTTFRYESGGWRRVH